MNPNVKRYHAIKARAKVIGLSVRLLAAARGIAGTSLWNWDKKNFEPKSSKLDLIDEELTHHEVRALRALLERFGSADLILLIAARAPAVAVALNHEQTPVGQMVAAGG